MPPTVMSDDDEVAPITARSRRTIIPSSRLVDSNNSVTPELTSHKYIQQTVQPVGTAPSTKTCPKRSAMDADWSLTSDIEDSDGNGKQTKGAYLCVFWFLLTNVFARITVKRLQRSRESSFTDDTCSIVSLGPYTGMFLSTCYSLLLTIPRRS
jgi:hypothetical protein